MGSAEGVKREAFHVKLSDSRTVRNRAVPRSRPVAGERFGSAIHCLDITNSRA